MNTHLEGFIEYFKYIGVFPYNFQPIIVFKSTTTTSKDLFSILQSYLYKISNNKQSTELSMRLFFRYLHSISTQESNRFAYNSIALVFKNQIDKSLNKFKKCFILNMLQNNKRNKSFCTSFQKSYIFSTNSKSYCTNNFPFKIVQHVKKEIEHNEKIRTMIRNNSRNGQIRINSIMTHINKEHTQSKRSSSKDKFNDKSNISIASKVYLNYTKKRWEELHELKRNQSEIRTKSAFDIRDKQLKQSKTEKSEALESLFSKLKMKKKVKIVDVEHSKTLDASKYLLNSTTSHNIK